MSTLERNRRALLLLGAGLLASAALHFLFPGAPVAAVSKVPDNAELAQQRLIHLRRLAATLPAREAAMKQISLDLTARETGIIQAETAAQAQATLLETARRIAKMEQIDLRGGDLGAPKAFGDYGLVYATIAFDCHIEQLVNFLADLARERQLVAPSEERITLANPKEKTMAVRIVLAGVVAKKLVPEKKGLAAF